MAGLSRQVARHNVTINALLPGIFNTYSQHNHLNGLVAQTGKSVDALWD